MLEVENVSAAYGLVQILWDVSFTIKEKEIVSIIGPNGAGKTTLVKTVMGLLPAKTGTIRFKGENIEKLRPYEIVKKGVTLIPEGREIFPKMTVEENMLLGAYTINDKNAVKESKERIYHIFPVLKKKEKALAQTLSGGEQQLLVICRSLMSNPELLILDEPSLGLAPIIVGKVLDTLRKINEEGVAVLLVEQNIRDSLNIADRGYVLEKGKIIIEGKGRELLSNDHIKEVYLGI
ncbi:MAG TPA: ABC transporter ATP-binding protein [Candidatus Bathyarchaeota archaeon]|nr:ABC transporter ATP-binding protein [Candidatus Bathyarchaeota archaeon]